MFRYLRFYITPIAGLAISLGLFYGGMWVWMPAFFYVAGAAVLDQFLKKDLNDESYGLEFFMDLALYLSLPTAILMFLSLFWAAGSGAQDPLGLGAFMQSVTGHDVFTARDSTAWYHYILMFISLILPATGIGGLAGHELTHRTGKPFDLWLGRITMALNWGIAFPIEHVYGHHSYVGTAKDPATAARGDSVYQHLPKAMYRTIVNAWEIETKRLDKIDSSILSWNNVLLRMAVISTSTTLIAYYCAGWTGVAFHLTVCFSTKFALEVLNYVEHYGLIREPDQPVQPRHSWNCNHIVSTVFTYNLTRHSHHHADAQAPYQDLKAYPEQPEMPNGLASCLLTSLVPSLWRKIITPKLIEWDAKYAAKSEYYLIAKANSESDWADLQVSTAD